MKIKWYPLQQLLHKRIHLYRTGLLMAVVGVETHVEWEIDIGCFPFSDTSRHKYHSVFVSYWMLRRIEWCLYRLVPLNGKHPIVWTSLLCLLKPDWLLLLCRTELINQQSTLWVNSFMQLLLQKVSFYLCLRPMNNKSEFIRLSKFELERELPQTTNQSKVVKPISD